MAKSANIKMHILYCKHSDVKYLSGDITDYLCNAVNQITPLEAIGAQKDRGVWAIALKSADAKSILLTIKSLAIQDRAVPLYGHNPFHSGGNRHDYERVVIKDYPMWEPNELVLKSIKSFAGLKLMSNDVMYSKARQNGTTAVSPYFNGDRFIFAERPVPQLPDRVKIGQHLCRIWYASKNVQCIRCGGAHYTNDDSKCAAFSEPRDDIEVFADGPLSNFTRCEVKMNDGKLSFITSEHAYQFRACEEHMRADLAEKIYKVTSPFQAKSIATEVKDDNPDSKWNQMKLSVMKEVLTAKLQSSVDFKNYLLSTDNRILVEASPYDNYWGSGLPFNVTCTTKPECFPGKNMLGNLLCELRSDLRSNHSSNINDAVKCSADGNAEKVHIGTAASGVHMDGDLEKSSNDSTVDGDSTKAPADIAGTDGATNTTATPGESTNPQPATSRQSRHMERSGSTAINRSLSANEKPRRSNSPLIREYFKQQTLKRKRILSPQDKDTSFEGAPMDDEASSVNSVEFRDEVEDTAHK